MGIYTLSKAPGHNLCGLSLSQESVHSVSQRQLKKENVLLEKACVWDILPVGGQQDCRRAADGLVACSVTASTIFLKGQNGSSAGITRTAAYSVSD